MEEEVRRVLDELSRINIDNPDLPSLLASKILFDRSLYSLRDCVVRRRLFFVVECFLVSLWQQSYFGSKRLDAVTDHLVSLFNILKEVVLEICFTKETVWFGGEQSCLETNPLNNAIVFLSCCWHAAALVVNICASNEIQNFLKASTRIIPRQSCLSAVLLTQDERCLSIAVALLYMETAKIDTPPQLKAMYLFRHTLFLIAYDHKVVLDWLYSELAAIPFILRFLKMLIKNKESIGGEQCSKFLCSQCYERSNKIRFVRSRTVPSGNDLTLRIRQLHGDLPITTTHTFSKIEREVCVVVLKSSEEESGDQQIVKCFENLRTTCIRLQNSGDAPFNVTPITKIVEQLQKVVIEDGAVSARKCYRRNHEEASCRNP